MLVVGSGAREHALAWRLVQSPQLGGLWVANGNAGTASIATNLDVRPDDLEGLAAAASSLKIDLVVVGPELPLSLGLVDRLTALGIPAFGPTKEAARLESSKSFAREVMQESQVPSPKFRVFGEEAEALAFLRDHQAPTVVKADGLAAGKGVFLCETAEEGAAAVRACMTDMAFGSAGHTVVIEEMLDGPEVSVFAFSDGEHLSSLVAACDYKRLEDGNRGPNTGGMGSFAPPDFWDDVLAQEVRHNVMEPVIQAMAQRGAPYRGVLYAGLMLTNDGPKVLEFNCRFGDPEAQVVLPRLESDPLEVMLACAQGNLDRCPVSWSDESLVGVVMASGGYPGDYGTGFEIEGLNEAALRPAQGERSRTPNTLVFHAATKVSAEANTRKLVTSGGRVLTVVGRGSSLAEARAWAYDKVRSINFHEAFYRHDIAAVRHRSGVWAPRR